MDNKILQKRTVATIIITILMMVAEIYYGITSNSMALTADGFHMATHVAAFSITLIVCTIAIKYCEKAKKLDALGGYTSALLLGFTSLGIICESVEKIINPSLISFNDAIVVAVIGFIVNLLCILIMNDGDHFHDHRHSSCTCRYSGEGNCDKNSKHEENLNYKAAYLHIVADAMTSILAIVALLFGKYAGLVSLDPIIGIFGGLVIAKWSYDLLKSSTKVLLNL